MSDHTSELSPTKVCKDCGVEHPRTAEYFGREKQNRDGLRGKCKMCVAEHSRNYRLTHREHKVEYDRLWRVSRRKEEVERVRRYRAANPECRRAEHHRRRARERGAEGSFSPADIERQRKAQKHRCYYCGEKSKLTIEHLVPLVRGGTNWPDNIVLACLSCNCRKQDKLPHEFVEGGRLL